MSNVIKAYSIRYGDETIKTIDTHLRIDKEIENRKLIAFQNVPDQNEDGFVEGLKAVKVQELPSHEELREQSEQMVEAARYEAEQIISQAKTDAEQQKKDAFAEAQKKGYEDGMAQVKKEAMKLKAEYDEKTKKLQEEYERMAESVEPQMVKIIAALVEKITGIVVEGKSEVILYLIDRAIKNMDKSDEYTIRVSKEDYEYVSMRKNLLLSAIGREVPLYIMEDPSLNKNQCLIETELKLINCSLDIQLNNLITDLKLIGGIV